MIKISLKNWYLAVFEVADFESVVRFLKFKMADPIRRVKISKIMKFRKYENLYMGIFGYGDY